MKRSILFLVLFVSAIFLCFSEENSPNIKEYFPVKLSTSWTYAGSDGKRNLTISVKSYMPNDKENNSKLYLFEEQWLDFEFGTTKTLYNVRETEIVKVVSKNINGQYTEYESPFPLVLANPNTIWTYNDRGEYLQYFTSKASCKFDDKVFSDCILVEEKLKDLDNDRILRIKKSYYAKYVGLVYVTLTGKDGKESVFMKLKETSLLKK